VRAPDAAFVRAEHVPQGADRDFFVRYPPDLAVEVMSRTDRLRRQAKCPNTSTPGVRVWLVEPKHQRVTVYCLIAPRARGITIPSVATSCGSLGLARSRRSRADTCSHGLGRHASRLRLAHRHPAPP
jgi:hypothetical protein